ncbi:uncharacterized protein LOC115073808 isoform X3 [Rhinatrema bivittatum]|uniref:uncharacterized protein LOC115073808 isoform X3 n=1 Tax=Rhinatrema bivittatum TaxID=194408 RepID=UPI0011266E45|nr:uncharacterized protein LOC115073808 isoform X3 [Rhinatrema bivittatum]
MTCRIQNIVHILFIFCFPELFSVQAMSSLPLPNEMENTGMVSSDSENVSLSPSRSVTSINRILEHHASTNWSTAATTSTSPNVTELSNLTTVSYFTTNTTNNKDTTPSDATGRFSTEATPSVTVYDPLKIPTTQGINPNITVSEITMLSSTDKLPTTQPNISVVTKQITKSFDALSTSQMSADRYSAPDDTLVISGGLYDAPRVYNPNMTVLEDEECQHDYISFGSRPGQFRLEFLPGEKEREPAYESSSFETFHSLQKNS